MNEQQRAWVYGLRELADWAEQHPDSPILASNVTVYGFVYDTAVDGLAQAAKDFGHARKDKTDSYYNVTRKFGPHTAQVTSPRENVCERRVVGVEEIPEQIIPEKVIPARTVEIVEWVCPESLLAAAS